MTILPSNPFHPGEILLEEFLKPNNISQAQLAKKLGWSRAKLNQIVLGKRRIRASAALDLAMVFGTSAKIWMNFQSKWDLDQAMKRRSV